MASSRLDDPAQAAQDAGLRYASDTAPGLRRLRRGRGFSYVDPEGRPVGAEERARIAALAIPPAWTDIWINPDPRGHLLATGRDDRRRKVYRYHDRWREVRDAAKFDRLADFAEALPDLRGEVEGDLGRRGLPPEKVVALVVRLLDDTLVRVGNERYAEDNESFGLTTLRTEHADIHGATVELDFVGKSGVAQRVALHDARLARLAKRCHELPGKHLFAYVDDDGTARPVTSAEVNDYLRDRMGPEVSAKDFRTWGGTTAAAACLAHPCPDDQPCEGLVRTSFEEAAALLGNTPTVCRTCYVHPTVPDGYRDGSLAEAWKGARATPSMARSEQAVRRLLTP
ncbi:MAG TPA: hypothetical protein VEW93_12305 [Acidimicrobiales bacterium]|nr:hypothetical protein [Acidimicrobiales bacterium]